MCKLTMSRCLMLLAVSVFSVESAVASTFYGLKTQNQRGTGMENTVLIEMESAPPQLVNAQTITLMGAGVFVEGLTMMTNGDLYAFVNLSRELSQPTGVNGAQLVSIDPATAQATPIGAPIANASINAAAFTMEDRLYAINVAQNQLIEVNPADGTVLSSVDASGLAFTDLRQGDIAFDSEDNAYVAISDHYSSNLAGGVYELDIATATLGPIIVTLPPASPNLAHANGLAFVDNDHGFITEESGSDEVVDIGPLTAPAVGSRFEIHQSIENLVGNAGSMDLAGMPNALTAEDDNVETPIDTPISGITVLDNDDQVLTGGMEEAAFLDPAFALSSAHGGTVTRNGDEIDYMPPAGFTGTDQISYQVCLPSGACDVAMISITVRAGEPPVTGNEAQQIPTLGGFGVLLLSLLTGLLGSGRAGRIGRG